MSAAAPVGETVIPAPRPQPSYTRAYVAIGAGLALSGVSFLLAEGADDAYDRYQSAVDPGTIEDEYDQAVLYDRLAGGTLLVGQAAIVLGLYWRLLKREPKPETGSTPGASGFLPRGSTPAIDGPLAAPLPGGTPPLRAELLAEISPPRLGVRLHF